MGKPDRLLSRKERRKKERHMKKAKKCAIYMKKHMKNPQISEEVKIQCEEVVGKKSQTVGSAKLLKIKKKERKRDTAGDIRRKQLEEENIREDRNIRNLEKKMKMNRRKRKTLPKCFIDDGLSYILEACDSETVKLLDPAKEFIEKDDFEEEEMESDKNEMDSDNDEMESNKDDMESDKDEIEFDVDAMESVKKKIATTSKKSVRWKDEIKDTDLATEDDNDDVSDQEMGYSDQEIENSDLSGNENGEKNNDVKPDLWEDIYGRKRDKEGKVVISQPEGKYIPPSKRCDASGSENIIEDLYLNNSRNDMNATLESLFYSSLVQYTLTPERLIQEHAMLIVLLHVNVGSEVGAHFLQSLVGKFNELHSSEIEEENKEIHNILLLLANLYNFKVVTSLLMINLLQVLAEKFSTLDLELILLLLKSIGFVLRKDDPVNLKNIILKLQSKAHESSQGENEARVRFMLDTLMAIKNNNMNKIPNYDPSHMDRLRKLFSGFVRKGCCINPLTISLDDLLNAETKGRWWIVGSSWSGDQLSNLDKKSNGATVATVQINEKILALAKKQRMNTDIRRNIFCIIMTAEDCVDCFEKLMKLGLQTSQEREIIHVIINCCMNEVNFNPYYAHLAAKFCICDRRFQMAFQYSLWDRFKELDNLKKTQSSNVAEFLAVLFTAQNLSISILKVIHFSEMNKHLVRFLRQLLIRVLLHDNFRIVFQKINPSPKLRMFREGLRLFLRHFILRVKDKIDIANSSELEERINEAEQILVAAESAVRF
uniref:MI domain-containing protein n=1 Tax=Strigamia maritima TaxID=126957 RepID=T1JAJ7_STRMM